MKSPKEEKQEISNIKENNELENLKEKISFYSDKAIEKAKIKLKEWKEKREDAKNNPKEDYKITLEKINKYLNNLTPMHTILLILIIMIILIIIMLFIIPKFLH